MITITNNGYNCKNGTEIHYYKPEENEYRFCVEAPGIREKFNDLEEVVTFLRAKNLFSEKLIEDLRNKVAEHDQITKELKGKHTKFSQAVLCDKFIDILKQADRSPESNRITIQKINEAEEELYRQLDAETAYKRQLIRDQAAVAHLLHRALTDTDRDSSLYSLFRFAESFFLCTEADQER